MKNSLIHSLTAPLSREAILAWLLESDFDALSLLWSRADDVRRANVGDEIQMRGLIEISNICRRQCLYCGIRAGNSQLTRYRLTTDEILDSARAAADFGYGTVVLQAGEDAAISRDWMTEIITRIKNETPVAVTLSLGERDDDDDWRAWRDTDWRAWRDAGADRYLLRFETSDVALFRAIHPEQKLRVRESQVLQKDYEQNYDQEVNSPRIEALKKLRAIGYEIGSGVMSGIPCQSWESLARDIYLFGELDLDMIGCGPFLPHPETPLGKLFATDSETGLFRPLPLNDAQKNFCREHNLKILRDDEQVIPSATLAFKVIALARLVCPRANIPSTTAIATIDAAQGRKLGLSRGANVIMPNVTPMQYRTHYAIYPNKAARLETPAETDAKAKAQLAEIGRLPAKIVKD